MRKILLEHTKTVRNGSHFALFLASNKKNCEAKTVHHTLEQANQGAAQAAVD
jgi:hypothetical protein